MKVKVYSSQKKSLLLALEEIKESIYKDFDSFDFLIFALSPKYNPKDINFLIKRVFETDKYVGFNAIKSFRDNAVVEGVSVLVIKFENRGSIEVFIDEELNKNRLKKYLKNSPNDLHIVLSSYNQKILVFFNDLEIKNYTLNNLIGGISSSFFDKNITFQYVDDKIIKNGYVIVSFKNVEFLIDFSLGFTPYGVTYKLAHVKDNFIYRLENGEKFSILIEEIFKNVDLTDKRVLWYMPLTILDEKDGLVSTLRTIKDFDKDQVELFAPVKENYSLKLSYATSDDLVRESARISKKINEKIVYPELILNFSCVAREFVLDKASLEIEEMLNIFNAHLFGFFTFGEIGFNREFNKIKLYNESSLIVSLKEI